MHPIPTPTKTRPTARAAHPLKRTRQKGDRIENNAIRLLKRADFRVEKRPSRAKWVGGRIIFVPVDWFGLFDWLAVKDGCYRWGQAVLDSGTGGGHGAETRAQLEAQAEVFIEREFAIPRVTIELWRWRPGNSKARDRKPRGWVVERYDLAKRRWVVVDPRTGDPVSRRKKR